ncbi:hypothetical protein H5407_21160 [Mitsuaria sp. WAJ17]|uniref:helix-turn-helix transcriptional regulator n=1 Tax=Mitsuaria sp. WAJ17 TaxID=2761452 RepID=UPI0016046F8E|nr:hypothetical protein [Mitsuaria sp. WAJ17]MBB2487754.1 hypothetical protein [Mitsuaria sp. WAJ17]
MLLIDSRFTMTPMLRSHNVSKRRLAQLPALLGAGLAPGDFIPALLEALHEVIPSARNLFDHTDAQGRLLHYYVEGPVDDGIAQHYFEHFHNRREADCMPAFQSLALTPGGVRSARPLMTPAFYNSALYQEIWKPQGLHSRIEGVVRDARGQLLGSLVLYRGPEDAPFSADEEQALAAVLPWVARGLQAGMASQPLMSPCRPRDAAAVPPPAGPVPGAAPRYLPAPEQAETLLLDAQGQLLSATAGAARLLLLATGGLTIDTLADGRAGMEAALRRVFASDLPPVGRGRSLTLINAHGRFIAEARALQGARDCPGCPTTLVTLRRLEPHAVALHRALRQLPLTAGQLQVCAALCQGHGPAGIAQLQGVAHSTVVDHIRKIYRALGVGSVHELCRRVEGELSVSH